jgi:hypothetical protein
MRSRLERMNDWCGRVLDKAILYDDLITFVFFAGMITVLLICLIVGTLGMLGYLK